MAPAVLIALTAAIRAHEVLRFDYRSAHPDDHPTAGHSAPPRRVEPHSMVTRGGRWYLIAFDLDREDWRTSRADRITPRTPTGPRFAPRALPGGDVAAFANAKFKGSTGADTWPCHGQVELGLPARPHQLRQSDLAADLSQEQVEPQVHRRNVRFRRSRAM